MIAIPEGDWFCPKCALSGLGKRKAQDFPEPAVKHARHEEILQQTHQLHHNQYVPQQQIQHPGLQMAPLGHQGASSVLHSLHQQQVCFPFPKTEFFFFFIDCLNI